MGNESMISMFSTEKMFVFNHFKRKLGKLRAEDVRGARPIRQLCDAGRRVAPSDDSSGEASAPFDGRNGGSPCEDPHLQ